MIEETLKDELIVGTMSIIFDVKTVESKLNAVRIDFKNDRTESSVEREDNMLLVSSFSLIKLAYIMISYLIGGKRMIELSREV